MTKNHNENELQEKTTLNPIDSFRNKLEANQFMDTCPNYPISCFCTKECQKERQRAIAQNGNTGEHY